MRNRRFARFATASIATALLLPPCLAADPGAPPTANTSTLSEPAQAGGSQDPSRKTPASTPATSSSDAGSGVNAAATTGTSANPSNLGSKGSSASAATPSRTVDDGIPQAIRELMPPDTGGNSAPSVPTGSINPQRPATASPPVSPATKSVPAHGIKASTEATAKKPAQPTILLRGRLEEVGGNGARLPVGVVLNLKTQTAHLDPSVEKQLQGRVASFPSDWAGQWGGTLTIWTAQFDPLAYQIDSEEATEEQQMELPGTQGRATFHFFLQNNMVALEPARIYLPMRTGGPMAKQLQQQLQNSPFGQMLGSQGARMLETIPTSQPVLCLGDINNGMSVTGNSLDNHVVKNDIRQLKPNVMEENIVVQGVERDHTTQQVRHSIGETVVRFTRLNPQQLYVQAATVSYRGDGHFLSKVLLYGTVNRGQGTAEPGALPGLDLDPSSGAGLGDLNKMLKQLQGL